MGKKKSLLEETAEDIGELPTGMLAAHIPIVCACGTPAVWAYMPRAGGDYCAECVPRGCSCNDVEDLDVDGRPLPCCEYDWIGS